MYKEDMNFKEFIELLGWSKNKFFLNIKKICSEEVYDININKFKKAGEEKEDYSQDERNFCFKSEWIDIAYVLFTMFVDNPFYRSNKSVDSVSLEQMIQHNKDCLGLVDQELSDYHRRQIQLHPTYQATLMEAQAMGNVSQKIQLLLTSISKMPVETRSGIWMNLDNLINHQLIQIYLSNLDAKEKYEKSKDELYKNQLYGEYEHISLDKYLAQVLKKEMDEEFVSERQGLGEDLEKAVQELDDMDIEVSGDTTEDMEYINEIYEALGLRDLTLKIKSADIENNIIEGLVQASEIIGDGESVEDTVDDIISAIKDSDSENQQRDIDKLNEIKIMIGKDLREIEKFSSVVDKVLRELNYNIINRQ